MEEIRTGARFRGVFELECWRLRDPVTSKRFRDKSGRFLPRQLVWREKTSNIITNEGLDRFLNVMLHGTTQTSPWYCGLVETDTTPTAAMTYDVPVFTESTSYDEATRPEYEEAASTARSTTNSANKATFTISATKTMYGAAIFSINTKGDHTQGANNVLFCYAKFSASRLVYDNDVINLSYTLSAADDGA